MLDWVIIGAGPAGISAVGKLLDQGVNPKKIGWVDPHFKVGDLGLKWNQVPSNTTVKLFLDFLKDCKAFSYTTRPISFPLDELDPKGFCKLEEIAKPLQWVSDQLKEKVQSHNDIATSLSLVNGCWNIELKTKTLQGKKVILAIGAEPKTLPLSEHQVIPIETVLCPQKLAATIDKNDTIGVFGSSHTAFLALANLHKLKANTINFYRSVHRYAVYMEDWILFDDTGLKGFTAKWAKEHIDGTCPDTIKRQLITDSDFEKALSSCTKLVYAVGFQRRSLPILKQYTEMKYDDKTGIIAPNLYGFGIAFPQAKFDPLGNLQLRVGLWKFMDYLNAILPIWMK